MIQHVVSFRFQGETVAGRRARAEQAHALLIVMDGQVPGLRALTISYDVGRDETHWDMVLVSHHDSTEALQAYIDHPLHIAAKAGIDRIVLERAIVDSRLGTVAQDTDSEVQQ
jgi:quinol monooxygenase YgiN